MLPKSGARLPKLHISLSEAQFAGLLAEALKQELGGSHRASKTIMTWTAVSDHTARAWLHGRKCPSSLHLLGLAAQSRLVMNLVLRLTGHDDIGVGFDLQALEIGLEEALNDVRALRAKGVR